MSKFQNLQEKRGDLSLLWVVLALIVVTAFQGHVNILNQTSVVNELQHQMDISGLNALNKTLDVNQIRLDEELFGQLTEEEFLQEYEKDIQKAFEKELFKNIPLNDQIEDVEIMEKPEVGFIRTEDSAVGTEHILLDVVVRITMNTFGKYDPYEDGDTWEGGKNKVFTRQTKDGQVQLYVQNQTRMQY